MQIMLAILLICLVVFGAISLPIGIAMGMATMLCLVFATNIDPIMVAQNAFAGIDSFSLMAIPFFMLAGNFMRYGGISKRLLDLADNVNRQLVSTKAGIAAASRPFILKTRTDILFRNADFLRYFGIFDGIPSNYFRNRLLVCNDFTRNPRVSDLCFHPSDWIVFGRAEDVREYYENTPLMAREDAEWFRTREKTSAIFTNYISRFTPEQYIFLGYLRQKEPVSCMCYYDCCADLIAQTERAFAECFVVLDYQKQLDIEFVKYDPNRYKERFTLLSHWQWKALYQHYCLSVVSPLWIMYRVLSGMRLGVSALRRILIRVLDRLGMKEFIKRLLSGRLRF